MHVMDGVKVTIIFCGFEIWISKLRGEQQFRVC